MAGAESSAGGATPFVPERPTLRRLREAAAGCRRCDLWRPATQTVFGEGLAKARVVMVGEMPGDREDLAGRPFVGPAGRELDLASAKPEAPVILGATAGKALLGASFSVSRVRGRALDSPLAPIVVATIHPSAIIRTCEHADRQRERDAFTADLRIVAEEMARH